jgi:hypothetical protein
VQADVSVVEKTPFIRAAERNVYSRRRGNGRIQSMDGCQGRSEGNDPRVGADRRGSGPAGQYIAFAQAIIFASSEQKHIRSYPARREWTGYNAHARLIGVSQPVMAYLHHVRCD